MKQARELVHGTCVALGRRGVLLRGGAGSGKSDLALRFMALPSGGALCPGLVADDQVYVTANPDGTLTASAPPTIAGKIEVRGLGIMPVPFLPEAELVLVCDLAGSIFAKNLAVLSWIVCYNPFPSTESLSTAR